MTNQNFIVSGIIEKKIKCNNRIGDWTNKSYLEFFVSLHERVELCKVIFGVFAASS